MEAYHTVQGPSLKVKEAADKATKESIYMLAMATTRLLFSY